MSRFKEVAGALGDLVTEKDLAYGSSVKNSSKILEVLYPNGIAVNQYYDMLLITRILDKLSRIANKKDAFGESPYKDIAGYALIGVVIDEELNENQTL